MTRRGSSRPDVRFTLTIAVAVIALFAAASCGLAQRNPTSGASLVVTRDFGSRSVASITMTHVPPSETVAGLLERNFHVETGDGGRTVTSIDGLSDGSGSLHWFLYINGVRVQTRTARATVRAGDRIWWDLHASTAADSSPAVVGSFPEPFVHGVGGRRLPTILACASDVSAACTQVAQELRAIGVSVANQALAGGSGIDSLSVLVGTWSDLNRSLAAALIGHGPKASGVYATFNGPGNRLELLDAGGRTVRVLSSGAGLIAATSENSASPTWLITGTDRSGVSAAAKALTAGRLDNHFALAVEGQAGIPLPRP